VWSARTWARVPTRVLPYARALARYYAARSLPISLAFGAGARPLDLEQADDSRKMESARIPLAVQQLSRGARESATFLHSRILALLIRRCYHRASFDYPLCVHRDDILSISLSQHPLAIIWRSFRETCFLISSCIVSRVLRSPHRVIIRPLSPAVFLQDAGCVDREEQSCIALVARYKDGRRAIFPEKERERENWSASGDRAVVSRDL